jgi:hypothetical protein
MNDGEEIILVGNGRSLVGRGLGQKIDSFPIVVRFNNFVTEGFEEHVGARTDWWARNALDEESPRTEPFKKIILRLGVKDFEQFRKGCTEVYPNLQAKYPHVNVEIIPLSVYTELLKNFGEKANPLTGTVIAAHLLRKYARVHVCGFDNMSGAKGDLRHYYSETATVGESVEWHEPDKEHQFMDGLIREGRVVVI